MTSHTKKKQVSDISERKSDEAEQQGYFERGSNSKCDVSKGRIYSGVGGGVMCDVEMVSLGRVCDSSLCSVRLSEDRCSMSHPSKVPL